MQESVEQSIPESHVVDDQYDRRFGGTSKVYGEQAFSKFENAHVMVIGIGGVGSWAVEALARSGVGEITADPAAACHRGPRRRDPRALERAAERALLCVVHRSEPCGDARAGLDVWRRRDRGL